MKRLFSLILCAVLMFAAAAPSLADVAFTPSDSFYNKHYEECAPLGRYYYVNSADGYVTVWDSPVASSVVDTIENGVCLFISSSYDNGKWGVVEYSVDSDGSYISCWADGDVKTGWILLSDMTLKYDNQSFTEEFGSQFSQDEKYQNALVGYTVKDTIYFYTYPGSGEISGELKQIDADYSELTFSDIYSDPDGKVWGYCGYYMKTNGWVCLDDPENGEMPMTLDRMPDINGTSQPSGTPEKPDAAVSGISTTTVAIIIIAVAVIVIAIVIYAGKRKKKAAQ